MRKSLWGYNISDADALINSLQNQNDLMTTKITNLTLELNNIKEEMRKNTSGKVPSGTNESEEAFQKKIVELEKENELLKYQNEGKIAALEKENAFLSAQVSSRMPKQSVLEKPVETSNLSNHSSAMIGTLCERVYHDMEKMRRETASAMMSEIDNYTDTVAETNEKMHTAVSQIQEQYEEIVEQLSESVNKAFELFHSIEVNSEEMKNKILPIDNLSAELKLNVKKAVQTSIKATEDIFRGKGVSDYPSSEYDKSLDFSDEALTAELENGGVSFPQWQKGKLKPEFRKEVKLSEQNLPKRDSLIGIHTKINTKDIIDL
jgi:hypothetical protein